MVLHVAVGLGVPSTIAAETGVVAVHQDLGRDVDIGPCSFTGDLDAIGEG